MKGPSCLVNFPQIAISVEHLSNACFWMPLTFFSLSVSIFFFCSKKVHTQSQVTDRFLESDENSGPLSPWSAFAHNFRWLTDSFWNPYGPLSRPRTSKAPAHSSVSPSQEETPYTSLSHRSRPEPGQGFQAEWVNGIWDWIPCVSSLRAAGQPQLEYLCHQEPHCLQRLSVWLWQEL